MEEMSMTVNLRYNENIPYLTTGGNNPARLTEAT